MAKMTTSTVKTVLGQVVRANQYSPFVDWINALPAWDSRPRLCHVFAKRAGGMPETDLAEQAAYSLIGGMIKRSLWPGCHHRTMVILYGDQKVGKTGFAEWLVGDVSTMVSDITLEIMNRRRDEMYRMLKTCRVARLDDMEHWDTKNSVEALKREVASTTFKSRELYVNDYVAYPARHVWLGTTNQRQHVANDPTGNSRYITVEVGKFDFDWLYTHRDQIFAEAKQWLAEGEDTNADISAFEEELAGYVDDLPLLAQAQLATEVVRTRKDNEQVPGFYTVHPNLLDLLKWGGVPEMMHINKAVNNQFAAALRACGWTRRDKNSKPSCAKFKGEFLKGWYLAKK
jgi:predicted P-loop ATPase